MISPLAPGPQPGNGAHKRALAGARFADHQHAFSRIDLDVRIIDHDRTVAQRHLEADELDGRPVVASLRSMMPVRSSCRLVELVERNQQRGDPARRGGPVGEPRIVVHEPVERGLHLHEGGSGLHHLAERHLAGEIFRRAQDDRNNRREHDVAVRDHVSRACAGGRAPASARSACAAGRAGRSAPPPRRRGARRSRRSRAAASAHSGTRPRPGSWPPPPARSCAR